MSIHSKRNTELSRAIAAANNTTNLKRKMELSKALAAAEDMNQGPADRSVPQNLCATGKRKRVMLDSTKNMTSPSISSSLLKETIINTRNEARTQREEEVLEHMTNTSMENITTEESNDNLADQESERINGMANEKRTRGLTGGLNTQKYTRKCGEKPKIIILDGINKPVGEHSSKHATQIGVLIRLEAPMQVEGWAKISDAKKEDLFRKLINKLNYDVEEPHVVQCIYKAFAKQYSTFRSNAHKYYQKVKAEGGVMLARQNIYEKFGDRRADWLWLCDYWETDKFKKYSEIQAKNRAMVKNSHKLGTKSLAAHQYEKNLDDIDMYEVEYYNSKTGWANQEVEANHAKMKEMREKESSLPDDAPRMSVEEICIGVLGENSS